MDLIEYLPVVWSNPKGYLRVAKDGDDYYPYIWDRKRKEIRGIRSVSKLINGGIGYVPVAYKTLKEAKKAAYNMMAGSRHLDWVRG